MKPTFSFTAGAPGRKADSSRLLATTTTFTSGAIRASVSASGGDVAQTSQQCGRKIRSCDTARKIVGIEPWCDFNVLASKSLGNCARQIGQHVDSIRDDMKPVAFQAAA